MNAFIVDSTLDHVSASEYHLRSSFISDDTFIDFTLQLMLCFYTEKTLFWL